MTSNSFLQDLQNRAQQHLQIAENQLITFSKEQLHQKPQPEKWSKAEVLEHLLRYNDYYLPRFQKAIEQGKKAAATETVKHSWFGNMSISMMSPDNTKPQKAKKSLNPSFDEVRANILESFIVSQKQLIQQLNTAATVSLNGNKIRVEVMPILRLRLGECMEFIVVHQERHFKQLERIV